MCSFNNEASFPNYMAQLWLLFKQNHHAFQTALPTYLSFAHTFFCFDTGRIAIRQFQVVWLPEDYLISEPLDAVHTLRLCNSQGYDYLIHALLFKNSLFIFREGKRERKRGEKHQCVVASHTPPNGDLAHNPSMCPDWESNWRTFGSQTGTQSTEHNIQGLIPALLYAMSLSPFVFTVLSYQFFHPHSSYVLWTI